MPAVYDLNTSQKRTVRKQGGGSKVSGKNLRAPSNYESAARKESRDYCLDAPHTRPCVIKAWGGWGPGGGAKDSDGGVSLNMKESRRGRALKKRTSLDLKTRSRRIPERTLLQHKRRGKKKLF